MEVKKNLKTDYVLASFSGGKDSTAMVLHMIEIGEHLDEVIFCDTYKEFPAMYRHVEKVRKIIEAAGIKFTELRSKQSYDYLMFEHKAKVRSKIVLEKYGNTIGYSWAGSRSRWCTSKLKQDVIRRYVKDLKKKYNLIQVTGIAADEQYRLEREGNKEHKHPLVEWGWSENDCLEYCYSHGFDWAGLYNLFNRVSCWCCPLQSLSELRTLRTNFPELWKELGDMDKRTWRKFRADYSVEELEIRFQFEEERISKGLSITNRDFHTQLKQRINDAIICSNKNESDSKLITLEKG